VCHHERTFVDGTGYRVYRGSFCYVLHVVDMHCASNTASHVRVLWCVNRVLSRELVWFRIPECDLTVMCIGALQINEFACICCLLIY